LIEGVDGPSGIRCQRMMESCRERLIESAPSLERVLLLRMSHSQIVEVLRVEGFSRRALLQELNDISDLVSFVTELGKKLGELESSGRNSRALKARS
jgi:hypothetical protein